MKKRFLLTIMLIFLVNISFAKLKADVRLIGNKQGCPYKYFQLSIENNTPRDLNFDIDIKDGHKSNNAEINGRLIEANSEKVYNLAVPFFNYPYFRINDSAGDTAQANSRSDEKIFLHISRIENWSTEKEMIDFCDACFKSRSSGNNYISQLSGENLPDDWRCYMAFTTVFIHDPVYNRMKPSEKEALNQWVHSGGSIVIYGSGTVSEIKALKGKFFLVEKNPLKSTIINNSWNSSGALKSYYKNASSISKFPYSIKKNSSGRIGGFALATIFLILAGPVNFIYFKKRKEIKKLLITVPIISIAFCLMITVYFFASQGFSKRGGSFSTTILDEKLDSAFTFSRHSIYSGLYPLGGFKFDNDVAFYPLSDPTGFSLNLSRIFHLKSGIFKPSRNLHYFTGQPYKTREKLIYDPVEKTITNGFETKINGLILKDNTIIYKAEGISPGEKVKLEIIRGKNSMSETFQDKYMNKEESTFYKLFMKKFLEPGINEMRVKYILRFRNNTPSVQAGTKIKAKRNCNILAGMKGRPAGRPYIGPNSKN
jgi:hypothetical protein